MPDEHDYEDHLLMSKMRELARERDEARAQANTLAEHLQTIIDSVEGGGWVVTFSERDLAEYRYAIAWPKGAS